MLKRFREFFHLTHEIRLCSCVQDNQFKHIKSLTNKILNSIKTNLAYVQTSNACYVLEYFIYNWRINFWSTLIFLIVY
jgi:hypothetical protein